MQGRSPDGGSQDQGGCTLSPAQLASPEAAATCAALTSPQSPGGCELRTDCWERFDACQAFITRKGCEASAAAYGCYWRADGGSVAGRGGSTNLRRALCTCVGGRSR